MKSATSERAGPAGAVLWRLASTLWVGAFWTVDFLLMPALRGVGLAPLLAEDVAARLALLSVGGAALAVLLQMLLLVHSLQLPGLWHAASGRILLALAGLALAYAVACATLPQLPFVLRLLHLMMGLCGLLLVLEPAPGERPLRAR